MRGKSLHPQAAINVRREQLVYPADIFTALFHAIIPNPQGDDGNEPPFLLGNHDQASSEPGNILQRSRECSGNRGLHAMRLLRLRHELHTQCGQA